MKMFLFEKELELEAEARIQARQVMEMIVNQAKEKKAIDTQSMVGKKFFSHRAYALNTVVAEWLSKQLKPKAGVKAEYIELIMDMTNVFGGGYNKNSRGIH